MAKRHKALFSALPDKAALIAVIALGTILVIAFGSYFYLQAVAMREAREVLLEQQQQRQIESVRNLSEHVASDLDSVALRLQLLASQPSLQRGELSSNEVTLLLEAADSDIRRISPISNVAILDENNIHVNNSMEAFRKFIGADRSEMEYVIETRKQMRPYISSGFTGASGTFGISLSVPISNEDTGSYLGMIVVGLPTIEHFERYGNVLDIDSQSIIALDRKGAIISTAIPEFLGQDFFGNRVQEFSGRNEQINTLYRNVMSGKADSALFTATLGERLSAGRPVYFGEEPVMFVFITTPTATIYSQVADVLAATSLRGIILLSAVSAAVIILIIFIIRWNKSLDIAVKQRSAELKESNDQLVQANSALSEYNVQLGNAFEMVVKANEQLETHDRMQKEFINIAAHELRTPVQPLLGVADILEANVTGAERIEISRAELEMIIRNAKRLERLSLDILEASRIESKSLVLQKEVIDLNEEVRRMISDAKNSLGDKKLEINTELAREPTIVEGDRLKLFEIISNLLSNAIKFTDAGIITVKVEKSGNDAVVAIQDSGSGIDAEVIPNLFTKFVSRSNSGTGLGLYISKSIVEAHGGRIWGQNNPDGKGATFGFSLPLHQSHEVQHS